MFWLTVKDLPAPFLLLRKNNMIIGITGKKKSGKDSFFKALSACVSVQQFAFGDDLKAEFAVACGCTLDYLNAHKDEFRTMLQWWGTDLRRDVFGKDYWVEKMAARIDQCKALTVITDVRFLNEAEFVKSRGGIMIRIIGGQSEEGDDHQSETEMDQIEVDHLIFNTGTLDDLGAEAQSFLKNFGQ